MASRTTTGTLTVNAAFLQEIKEVNLDLWQLLADLRERSAEPGVVANHRRAWARALEELRDQLALHFALEEAYGYFEDPIQVAPRLCEKAHELRAEHRQLYVEVCDLVERAQQLRRHRDDEFRVEQLLKEFLAFDQRLRNHESAENALILCEYDDDLGGGD